jgi:hypothetical protein
VLEYEDEEELQEVELVSISDDRFTTSFPLDSIEIHRAGKDRIEVSIDLELFEDLRLILQRLYDESEQRARQASINAHPSGQGEQYKR